MTRPWWSWPAWQPRLPAGVPAIRSAALLSADFIHSVTTPHEGFELAFGPDGHAAIPPDLVRRYLPRRWNGYLGLPMLSCGAKPANDWPSFVRLGRGIGTVRLNKHPTWPEIECRLFGARCRRLL